jgi:hypothetical protein
MKIKKFKTEHYFILILALLACLFYTNKCHSQTTKSDSIAFAKYVDAHPIAFRFSYVETTYARPLFAVMWYVESSIKYNKVLDKPEKRRWLDEKQCDYQTEITEIEVFMIKPEYADYVTWKNRKKERQKINKSILAQ